MNRIISASALFVVCSIHAYEPERAKNNFAHEAAECSAYFLFVSTAPKLSTETVTGLQAKYEGLFKISATFSSPEVASARVKLSIETMRREMKLDWSNLSIVNQKFGYACNDFVNDPAARLKYWTEKTE